MAKTISVNLAFTADTSAARNQLNALKSELTTLTTSAVSLTGGKQLGITTELAKAATQAAQLKVQLEGATNVNTGRLDLTKFNSQLRQSGMSISQYKNALQQLGPQGQQAFSQLAMAVSQAETPIFRTSTMLTKLGQTLKNTVRWQLTSSLVMGFVRGIQQAYQYSQDLNESLNNIRIVTGKTVSEMDKFADRANKIAKTLSTSTLEYTKASLIYYQQGIRNQQEIEARTNATIKLANVTGTGAQEVSEWMTAIWNNYDNGSRSLENYADVLAKLGAETASSADEIATGMEKFAAIGDTVGLSYNNAAAALATITATTRQSADVVGTALKTLFSRMEQLKLGETLDDGTTLGKYSEALKTVGVNIKDANGELKAMDDIIAETGQKWQTLGNDQKVALAQSVAGIRQYTHFMALMENYDMYKGLVNSAANATGTLQEQQKIYEESWEAASKRVQASLEKVYEALLNDKFFIGLTDLLAHGVDLIGIILDGLGGVGGFLSMFLLLGTKIWSGPVANIFNTLRDTFYVLLPGGANELNKIRQQTIAAAAEMFKIKGVATTTSMLWEEMGKAQNLFLERTKKMVPEQQKIAQALMDQKRILIENAQQQEAIARSAKDEAELLTRKNTARMMQQGGIKNWNATMGSEAGSPKIRDEVARYGTQIRQSSSLQQVIQGSFGGFKDLDLEKTDNSAAIERIKAQYASLEQVLKKTGTSMEEAFGIKGAEALQKLQNVLTETPNDTEEIRNAISALLPGFNELDQDTEKLRQSLKQLFGADSEQVEQALQEIEQHFIAVGNAEGKMHNDTLLAKQGFDELENQLDQISVKLRNFGTAATTIASGISGIASFGYAIKGLYDVFNDENMSGMQKFLTILMSISSMTFGVTQIIRTAADITDLYKEKVKVKTKITEKDSKANIEHSVTEKIDAEATRDNARATEEEINADKIEHAGDEADTQGNVKHAISEKLDDGDNVNKSPSGTPNVNTPPSNTPDVNKPPSDAPKGSGGKGTTTAGGKGAVKTAGGTAGWIIAGVLVAAASIYAAVQWWNKDANALKKAQEDLEGATKRAEESQNRYNTMKDNISDYTEAKKGIEALTKGTLEFDEAVADANEKAMKLLETYRNLEYTVDDNGVIQINEQSLKNARAQEFRRMQVGQMEQKGANMRMLEAQNQADTTKFLRDKVKSDTEFGSKEDNTIIGGSMGAGAGLGMAIGTIVPGVGNAIGAIVGGLIGLGAGLINGAVIAAANKQDTDEQEYEAMEQLVKAYESGKGETTSINDLINGLDGVGNNVKDALKENADETKNLAKQIAENNRLISLQKAENLKAYMENSGKSYLLETDYATAIAALASKEEGLDVEDNRAEWWRLGIGHKFTDADGNKEYMSDKEIREAYVKARYGEDADYTSHWLTGQITGVTVNGQKVDGIDSTNVVKFDTMRNFLADQATNERLSGVYEDILGDFQGYQTTLQEAGFSSSEASGITKRIADAAAGIDKNGNGLLAMTDQEAAAVQNLLNSGALGEYSDAVKDIMENWDSKTAASLRAIEVDKQANEIWATGASQTGVSAKALEYFTDNLMENNAELSDNKVAAANASVAHAKFAKGIEKLHSALKNNAEALDASNRGSFEYAEALAEVGLAVEEAFGVKVSSEFLEEHLGQIRAVANGATEGLDELRWAMAEDFVFNLAIKDDVKNSLTTLLDQVQAQDPSIEIGGSFNNQAIVDGLNEALEVGDITADQITQAFGAIGYTPNIQYKKVKNDSVTSGHITLGGEDSPFHFGYTNVIENETEVPYIASADGGTSDEPLVIGDSFTKTNNAKSLGSSLGASVKSDAAKANKTNKETIESLKDEKDRYEDINKALDDMARKLERIQKEKNKAFGQDKIKLMSQERDVIKEEVETLEQKSKQLKEDVKNRFSEISKYGYTFDANTGSILNSNAVYDAMLKKYEKGLAAAGADEDAQEKWQKWWDTFINDTEKYNETLEESKNVTEEIADKRDEIIESEYEELEYTIEINVQVNDWGLKTLERRLGRIEDNAFAAAEAIKLLGQQASAYEANFNMNKQGIEDLLKYKGATQEQINKFLSGDGNAISGLALTEKDFELLDEYREGMGEALDSMEETFDTIFEKLTEVFDAINEKFDKVNEKLEHAQSILTSMNNIIDLVGATNLGISKKLILDIADAASDLAIAQVAAATAKKDKNQQMLAEAKEALAKAATEDEKKKWQEQIDYFEEQVQANEQEWLDSVSAALETGTARREKAVTQAMEAFLQETIGYKTMDEFTSAKDNQRTANDLYIKAYEKAYTTSKLSRNIANKLNETTNIKAKQQLLDLENKINKIKAKGAEISKYELDYMQKEYDLLLARIALEEAQNTKSQLRLTRNAEGSMSYVYTADRSKISDAEQKLEDAIYSSTQLTDEWIKSIEDGTAQAYATFAEQMQLINTTTYDSDEERLIATEQAEAELLTRLRFYSEQMGIALDNNETLYNDYVTEMGTGYSTNALSFSDMFKTMYESGEDFYTQFKDTLLPKISEGLLGESGSLLSFYTILKDKLGTTGEFSVGTKPSGKGLYGQLAMAQYEWEQFVTKSFDAAGVPIGTFANNIAALNGGESGQATGEMNKFRNYVSKYIGWGSDGYKGVRQLVSETNEEINELQKNTDFTKAKDAAVTYGEKVAEAMAKADEQLDNVNNALSTLITKWGKDGVGGLPDIDKTIRIKTVKTNSSEDGPDVDGSGDNNYTPTFSTSKGGATYQDMTRSENLIYTSSRYTGDGEMRGDSIKDINTFNAYGVGEYGSVMSLETLSNKDEHTYNLSQPNLGVLGDYGGKPMAYVGGVIWGYATAEDERNRHRTPIYYLILPTEVGLKSAAFTSNPPISYKAHYANKTTTHTDVSGFFLDTKEFSKYFTLTGKDVHGLPNIEPFDTGGYTGEWGPEGRLALLHQKEIVLNAHDTENILQVVDMVRQLTRVLDLNTLAMSQGLGSLVTSATVDANNRELDQNVTITAEFPNATNREEIQAAFGNLVNLAAQYANRN